MSKPITISVRIPLDADQRATMERFFASGLLTQERINQWAVTTLKIQMMLLRAGMNLESRVLKELTKTPRESRGNLIEEIAAVVKCKWRAKESKHDYLERLAAKVYEAPESVWNRLSKEAQEFVDSVLAASGAPAVPPRKKS